MIKEFLGQLKKSWNVLENNLQTIRKEMSNMRKKEGIPYRYEYPVYLRGLRG